MACQVGARMLQSGLSVMVNEVSERTCITIATCAMQNRNIEPSFSGQASKIGIKFVPFQKTRFQLRRQGWRIAFALDTGGLPGNGEQENVNGDSPPGLGGTRLGRIVSAGGRQLLEKLNSARKNFPMKIFLLLLGFYTANALATILGQTGDWDVLVAGIVVAAIEGIGMLMYKKPSSLSTRRLQYFVAMMNYWKAGVCLGLFVDAFKLGS
ncbi:ycf20-like protein [Populus nigra]|uniref:ycf20-like protein n=1 Tax=Populus nigra TaxID=3691 RepID=UPI002B278D64|nr:ycf20-like protein [Populus nigra]